MVQKLMAVFYITSFRSTEGVGYLTCNASGLNLTFVLAAEGKTQLFLID